MSVAQPSRLDVAFVVPRSGPAGIFGPSCEACGRLAAEEINEADGVLGRELRLHAIDGGRAPEQVAAEVDALVGTGLVDAVAGWHISAVRQRLTPIVAGRVPYVYSPGYEGRPGSVPRPAARAGRDPARPAGAVVGADRVRGDGPGVVGRAAAGLGRGGHAAAASGRERIPGPGAMRFPARGGHSCRGRGTGGGGRAGR
jgi:hypothetical protein